MITGKTLIAWGHEPAPWFKEAIDSANSALATGGEEAARAAVSAIARANEPPRQVPLRANGELPYHRNIEANDAHDAANIEKVDATMRELMRTPTIRAGAVMPDACPAGPMGTIPVGGVVACKDAIHPGFHSADICCSMALSVLGDVDPSVVLDAGMKLSHFGPGARAYSHDMRPSNHLLGQFEENTFLSMTTDAAQKHFGTQGDGNHFFFVGRMQSTGHVAIVTHHGSRKPGALLYKAGMEAAERYRCKLSPETLPQNAWIPIETSEGETYWNALQVIRTWTKHNHFAIHDAVAKYLGAKIKDRFWNEHNFVFERDGMFFHGKGATPAWEYYAADSSGLTLIPLNMAEPILVVRGRDAKNGLGFSPHGAGRNWGRKEHIRRLGTHSAEDVVKREAPDIDVRFWCGAPDVSELPSAYKSAETVRDQIAHFDLAEIVDQIVPTGTIMAGDWARDAPWRRKKRR